MTGQMLCLVNNALISGYEIKSLLAGKMFLCFLSAGRLKPLHLALPAFMTVTEEVYNIGNPPTSVNITAMSPFL